MTQQYPPPFDPSVLVMLFGWAAMSAVMLVITIRMGPRPAAWVWAFSFVVASMIAAVFFWRLVRGEA